MTVLRQEKRLHHWEKLYYEFTDLMCPYYQVDFQFLTAVANSVFAEERRHSSYCVRCVPAVNYANKGVNEN
ncbi:hypothetical protein KIN20_002594 [Parelaphostrongylus tenuis]|uniref:Uncharacterized protein n=1 Tax=Parelaphostrongylus tenuis TaxID=148309 RepID=A0AAD5LW13_PARTN|nr:hypothetical protein KIN20_002594 [Parelaphostrongylus tenuis]